MPQGKPTGRGTRDRAREIEMANIKCGNCKDTHASVREVRTCYVGGVISRAVTEIVNSPEFVDTPPVAEVTPAEEGMYKLGNRIFKVQRAIHGSGHLYAKELVSGGFTYAGGMIRKLNSSHRMTLEQAKEYGALYGVCCRCAAPLTDEKSIAAGIGPVCATKF
jgi:hypothetical protein